MQKEERKKRPDETPDASDVDVLDDDWFGGKRPKHYQPIPRLEPAHGIDDPIADAWFR